MREGGRARLVFLPTLVANATAPEASVRGVLCYQRKGPTGQWEPYEAINLNHLKAGEGVRLDLHSAEVLTLYGGLASLYAIAKEHGVPSGIRSFIEAPQSDQLRELLDGGTLDELLADASAGLLEAFLGWLSRQDTDALAERLATAGEELISFDAAIGVARLKSFLADYEANRNKSSEAYWQHLLELHNWAISQTYAYPFVIIRGQAYVGGKGVDNRGGSVVDFLYRNAATDNVALVEIKTPATPLLGTTYRNNAFNVSRELSGASQQLLVAKSSLVENYRQLAGDELRLLRPFSPKALLIAGDTANLPAHSAAQRSFELYRNNLRELDVITFDELAEKIKRLVALLEEG